MTVFVGFCLLLPAATTALVRLEQHDEILLRPCHLYVIGLLSLSCGRRLFHACLTFHLRVLPILPLIVVSCYSHIFGGWAIFNYINEPGLRHMFNSQMFFCVTEILTTMGSCDSCIFTVVFGSLTIFQLGS
jgi:hypothetical protein